MSSLPVESVVAFCIAILGIILMLVFAFRDNREDAKDKARERAKRLREDEISANAPRFAYRSLERLYHRILAIERRFGWPFPRTGLLVPRPLDLADMEAISPKWAGHQGGNEFNNALANARRLNKLLDMAKERERPIDDGLCHEAADAIKDAAIAYLDKFKYEKW